MYMGTFLLKRGYTVCILIIKRGYTVVYRLSNLWSYRRNSGIVRVCAIYTVQRALSMLSSVRYPIEAIQSNQSNQSKLSTLIILTYSIRTL